MSQQITNLAATTELEAVNAMLSAIGEAPLPSGTDLGSVTQPDVAMALSLLRASARDVQAMKWKFNTEFGYELAPATTLAWAGTDGSTATLNIFTPPSEMIGFSLTPTADQVNLDLIVRRPRSNAITGSPAQVFYDRALNRDGLDSTKFPFLYINPVWLFDFEQMPEEARAFITVRSARQFIQQTVGSTTLSGFTDADEQLAYRNLKRAHGEEDAYNMFNSMTTARFLGQRPLGAIGMIYDPRKSPGPTP